jgi:nickel/cobalt exporter
VSNTPALLAASAGVAVGHAILPDHWVPLATIGRTRRYSLARVARLSGLAGVAHVFVSLALGGVIVLVGLQFRSRVQDAQDTIVGALLIATGIGFLVAEALGRGRSHAHPHPHPGRQGHPHAHPHGGGRIASLASVMVPFGAAASPDLTILPVFLAATTAGVGTAIASLVVFGAVTIVTIVALTLLATIGGYQIRGRWLDRWGNVVTAAVLAVIGGLVLAGVI